MARHGLAFSGFAQDLWSEQLLNTRDTSHYVESFQANCDFAVDLGIKGIRVDTVQPPTIHREADYADLLKPPGRDLGPLHRLCRRQGALRHLGVRAGLRLQQAVGHPARAGQAASTSNFGVLYDTCHGQMVAVVGARQEGRPETLPGGQLELIARLSGRINHIHLIDSDNSCHKAADGSDETSAHPPFGEGLLDFDALVPALAKEKVGHDWWTVDLCFWPDAWAGHGQVQGPRSTRSTRSTAEEAAMLLGFNLLLWTTHVDRRAFPAVRRAQAGRL